MKKVILFLVALVVLVLIGYWLTNSSSPQVEKGCKAVQKCCVLDCVAEEIEVEKGGGCVAFCPRIDHSWQVCGKNNDGQCGWKMSLVGRIVNVFEKLK